MIRSLVSVGLVASLLFLPAALSAARKASLNEWPQWRGPNRDGISPETDLLDKWPEKGPPLVWKATGLGGGFSSVAVDAGKIYTLGSRDRKEHLSAIDGGDGKILWSTPVGGGDHSNGTPTVDGDRVYAIGLQGDLVCAKIADGQILWKKNFGSDFGGKMMSGWGFSESPLIDGDRLICTPGGNDAMIVALDKMTGDTIWKAAMPSDVGPRGKDGAGYSSIVVSHGAGVKQYVQLIGRGVIGVRAENGEMLWGYNRIANDTANIPTPIVSDDYVFCSSGYGTGAALLKLVKQKNGVKAMEKYFLNANVMQNHHGGMVLVGKHVYCGNGHNQGFPLCVDLLTGKVAWHPGRGPGQESAAIAYADGNLYFRYQNGVMALIEATPKKYNLKSTFELPGTGQPSWPHPAIAEGRLYLRDQDLLFAYDIQKK
ncbi:MAG TPA: PQQ-binding-like beta-propeller repeat protein [Pirellulales bacterium]|nr:PQQ-binding-like beta-propeller repeat protein [Pirellulales bacterium]